MTSTILLKLIKDAGLNDLVRNEIDAIGLVSPNQWRDAVNDISWTEDATKAIASRLGKIDQANYSIVELK